MKKQTIKFSPESTWRIQQGDDNQTEVKQHKFEVKQNDPVKSNNVVNVSI